MNLQLSSSQNVDKHLSKVKRVGFTIVKPVKPSVDVDVHVHITNFHEYEHAQVHEHTFKTLVAVHH